MHRLSLHPTNINNPLVYTEDYDFTPGKAIMLRNGCDVAIFATSTMVHTSLKAAELLAEKGVEATVCDIHTTHSWDEDILRSKINVKLLVNADEHFIVGGLCSAMAECLATWGSHPPLLRLGINPAEGYPYGDTYANLLDRCGLTVDSICQSVLLSLNEGAN